MRCRNRYTFADGCLCLLQRSVWVCNTCSNRRKQQSVVMATSQQQDVNTYSSTGQKVPGDPSGRKDDPLSREYHLHPVDDVVTPPHPDTAETGPEDYYLLVDDEEDEDDRWTDDIDDRTSSIRRMLEEADEEEEEEEDYDGASSLQTYYDRSPGEVYTIPEEEEEMVSPMMGVSWDGDLNPDTASSLLRWRGIDNPQPSHPVGGILPPPLTQRMNASTANLLFSLYVHLLLLLFFCSYWNGRVFSVRHHLLDFKLTSTLCPPGNFRPH
ncbi:uncharacterized protein CDAR_423801 [Caerostris darwini]|uniref:Uncharacterized protein n=1 Tax=Caerostris darwini TaxID=1538125 RepID=A0AAV4WDE9_9ARAC|nr:uncharacterized protein CDAR_423801 [Caerostris darwini]